MQITSWSWCEAHFLKMFFNLSISSNTKNLLSMQKTNTVLIYIVFQYPALPRHSGSTSMEWNKHQLTNIFSCNYITVTGGKLCTPTPSSRSPARPLQATPDRPHPLTLRCSSFQRRPAGWTRPPGAAHTWRGRWRTPRGSGGSAGSLRAGWCRTCSAPWRSWTGRSPSAYAACSHASGMEGGGVTVTENGKC